MKVRSGIEETARLNWNAGCRNDATLYWTAQATPTTRKLQEQRAGAAHVGFDFVVSE